MYGQYFFGVFVCVCVGGGGVYTCTCIYQSSLQLRENCYSIWFSLPPYSFAITNNEQTFFSIISQEFIYFWSITCSAMTFFYQLMGRKVNKYMINLNVNKFHNKLWLYCIVCVKKAHATRLKFLNIFFMSWQGLKFNFSHIILFIVQIFAKRSRELQ